MQKNARALGALIVLSGLIAAGCGGDAAMVEAEAEGLAPPTTSTTTLAPSDAVARVTPSPATEVALDDGRDDRFFAWYSLQQTATSHAVPYLVAASADLDELFVDQAFVVEVPFGMAPGDGRLQIWSEAGGVASHPAGWVNWPVECLGGSPDVDGDGLLDDCDPYPADGPRADWDSDGVLNPSDNCPTVPNPTQEREGDRFSGVACDSREGVSAEVWLAPAEVTLESWNVVRAERGLDPIVMPAAASALPTDVAGWCDRGAAIDLDAPDEDVVALLLDLPEAYGLTDGEIEALIELTLRNRALAQAYFALEDTDAAGDDPSAVFERLDAFQRERLAIEQEGLGLRAPLTYSDLACPR